MQGVIIEYFIFASVYFCEPPLGQCSAVVFAVSSRSDGSEGWRCSLSLEAASLAAVGAFACVPCDRAGAAALARDL